MCTESKENPEQTCIVSYKSCNFTNSLQCHYLHDIFKCTWQEAEYFSNILLSLMHMMKMHINWQKFYELKTLIHITLFQSLNFLLF